MCDAIEFDSIQSNSILINMLIYDFIKKYKLKNKYQKKKKKMRKKKWKREMKRFYYVIFNNYKIAVKTKWNFL
jgi:hypothetical protein